MYLGSSSLGEMTSAKEETYRIARALGAPLNSRVIAHVDYRTVGLMPNKAAADFVDSFVGSLSAHEVERDHLKVPYTSLGEVVSFHATSVSIVTCISLIFVCL